MNIKNDPPFFDLIEAMNTIKRYRSHLVESHKGLIGKGGSGLTRRMDR